MTATQRLGWLLPLLLMSRPGWSQDTLYHWDGEPLGFGGFGESLARAGDTNGDGSTDLLVTDWTYSGSAGRVYVYCGGTGTLLGTITGANAGDAISTVAGVGDVDRDSCDDFLVGAARIRQAYLYSGKSLNLLFTIPGPGAGSAFGGNLAGLGDVNGDHIPDFLIGADGWANYSPFRSVGRAYAYSGKDAGILYYLQGEWEFGNLSYGLTSPGDLNDDGQRDFILSATNPTDKRPRIYVHSASDGSLVSQFDGNAQDRVATLGSVGDLDGDRVQDYVVGTPTANAGSGVAYVYSGRTNSLIYTFVGNLSEAGNLGARTGGSGDANGDGIPDLLISAPRENGPNKTSGHVYLYSGRNGRLLYEFRGKKNNSEGFGSAVAGLGDLNHDGFADFAIGAPGHRNGGSQVGGVWVFAGNDLFLQGELDTTGRNVTLHTRGGPPNGIAVTYLTKVSGGNLGGPRFVNQGFLDGNGEWSFSVSIPPTLWGYKLTFRSFATHQTPFGKPVQWIDSADEKVVVPP